MRWRDEAARRVSQGSGVGDLSVEERAQKMVAALGEISVLLDPILDAVEGYKAKAEGRGFSPTEVEMMGLHYHGVLMAAVSGSSS